MSIYRSTAPGQPKQKCARCGLMFTPKKEGDNYGPRCARRLAGQMQLDCMTLVPGKVLKA